MGASSGWLPSNHLKNRNTVHVDPGSCSLSIPCGIHHGIAGPSTPPMEEIQPTKNAKPLSDPCLATAT